jgi:NhaP-type Na+/H+ or K+/H+ antiporter
MNARRCHHLAAFALAGFSMTGCARAPALDILGSFFPAWLICLAVGLLLTFLARWLLSRLGIVIAVPVLTYPSLTVLFACALWLVFFH